jgi:1,4-dihydroxy-2-naphthoate octaprenyltransferase
MPFRALEFALAMIGMVCVHFGLNLSNDYFDHTSGNDEINLTPTPFSGGSRVIQEKLLPPRALLSAALFFFACGAGAGFVLNWLVPGNVVLYVGLAGVALAFFYTASPVRIGYVGLGEILCAVGFGPMVVVGSYYVQAHKLDTAPLIASIPVGILIALVLFINEFPDFEADRAVKKRTLVVLLGKGRAVWLYAFLLACPFVAVGVAVALRRMPVYALAVFAALPLAIRAGTVAARHHHAIKELLPACKATIGLHALFGTLLIAGFLV